MEIFGLKFFGDKKQKEVVGITSPQIDDGAEVINATTSAHYGVYLDLDSSAKNETAAIKTYREIAGYPEIDLAIQDIVNEAIPHEDDTPQLTIVLDRLSVSDNLKDKITEAFDSIISKLGYTAAASDLFRKWYVDGRLNYEIIVDKDNPRAGITELRNIDPLKIKKIREVKKEKTASGVEIITDVIEYYIYSEFGLAPTGNTANVGVKISADAIVQVGSGELDPTGTTIQGFLHKAIRPINMLRMLEDATTVYRIARAPERRVFYIDVGTLPKAKAEQYVKDIMNQYRNKMVYDAKTGNIRDDKKYMSMLEDFWLPRREGNKGTQIDTLAGAQNLGMVEELNYFKQNVYNSLNIPIARMLPDQGFSLGRTTEITRDELKFQKYIDKLRRKFSQLFYSLLKTELLLRGICNSAEWDLYFKDKIFFKFQRDNYFAELKELDVLQARMAIMPQIDPYLGKYWSKKWVQKNILRMSDEDIEQMDAEIASESGDMTAQPSFAAGGMGGDPNAFGGQFGMGGTPQFGTPVPEPQGNDDNQQF